MLLQFVYFAFAIYGWWHWWRGVKEEGIVKVEGSPGEGSRRELSLARRVVSCWAF